MGDLDAALASLAAFCERNPSLAISVQGPLPPGRGAGEVLLACGDLLAALRGEEEDAFAAKEEQQREEVGAGGAFYCFRWRDEAVEVHLHRSSGRSEWERETLVSSSVLTTPLH